MYTQEIRYHTSKLFKILLLPFSVIRLFWNPKPLSLDALAIPAPRTCSFARQARP